MRQGGRLLVRAHDATDYSADTPQGSRGIRITIADTGHGMSPAVRARLFEPFYTTKDLNGTGLGLWISSGIVTRHHGRLTFRSTSTPIHHGTVFSLFLPASKNRRRIAQPSEAEDPIMPDHGSPLPLGEHPHSPAIAPTSHRRHCFIDFSAPVLPTHRSNRKLSGIPADLRWS